MSGGADSTDDMLLDLEAAYQAMQSATKRYYGIRRQLEAMNFIFPVFTSSKQNIPREIWILIASECDPVSYLRLALSCRTVRSILLNPIELRRYLRKCELRWNAPMATARAAIDALDSPGHVFSESMILMHMAAPWVFNGEIVANDGYALCVKSNLPDATNVTKGALCIGDKSIVYANGTCMRIKSDDDWKMLLLRSGDRMFGTPANSEVIYDLTEGCVIGLNEKDDLNLESDRHGISVLRKGNSIYVYDGLPDEHKILHSPNFNNVPKIADARFVSAVATDERSLIFTFYEYPNYFSVDQNGQTVCEDDVKTILDLNVPTDEQRRISQIEVWSTLLWTNSRSMCCSWRGWSLIFYKDKEEICVLDPRGISISSFKITGLRLPWTISDQGIISSGSQFFFFTFRQRNRPWNDDKNLV